jgi:indolepyruvate ferredoxin oxidoreductase beta subunit
VRFDVLLTGVGGTGVLTSGVIIARAANIEGYYVRGVQLHGLAQKGGIIPTFVCFGSESESHSPGIIQGNADLVLSFEPLEAVRAAYYARKEKTIFVISDSPVVPTSSYINDIPYPDLVEIKKRIEPFAKEIHVLEVSKISKREFGKGIFGNTLLLGYAVGKELLPLKEESLLGAIKVSAPRELESNIKAFKMGLKGS